MLGWKKDKLESIFLGEISITSADTTLMAVSKEELKSLMMKVKRGECKNWLKVEIQKTNIMASSPITSCQTDGETVANYIFGLQNHWRY